MFSNYRHLAQPVLAIEQPLPKRSQGLTNSFSFIDDFTQDYDFSKTDLVDHQRTTGFSKQIAYPRKWYYGQK